MAIAGKFLIGVGTNKDTNNVSKTFTANQIGGKYNHTHTLNNAYGHLYIGSTYIYYNRKDINYHTTIRKDCGGSYYGNEKDNNASDLTLGGTTDGPNDLPPYLAVYMWQRMA